MDKVELNTLVVFATLSTFVLDYVFINVFTGGVSLVLYTANRRGHVQVTVQVFCFLLWAAATVGIFGYAGIYDPYISGYIFVIITTALLINGFTAFVYTLLTLAVGFGWIMTQPDPGADAIEVWLAYCFIFTASMILMWLAQRGLENMMLQIREKEHLLEQKNALLEREIAGRQQAEATLRDREAQYRQMLDSLPAMIVVTDTNLICKYTNPNGKKLAGVSTTHQVIGMSLYQVFPELSKEQLTDTQQEHQISILIDNQPVDVAIRNIPFVFRGEQAYLHIITDITERKELEQERLAAEKLRIQISEEQKIHQMKETFTAMISHEFRTPLSVIQSSQDILTRHGQHLSPEKHATHLNRIKQQIKRMSHLLRNGD